MPDLVPNRPDSTVKWVQSRLLELGYTGGGPADGLFEEKTKGAILNFRNRNGLPTVPVIDNQLLARLHTAPPLAVPVEQATATAKEIAPNVVAVKQSLWSRFWAKVLAFPALALTAFFGVVDNLGDAVDKLVPLKTFLSEYLAGIPPLRLILIGSTTVSVVSLVLWWSSGKATKALEDGFRRGTVRNDNPQGPDPVTAVAMKETT